MIRINKNTGFVEVSGRPITVPVEFVGKGLVFAVELPGCGLARIAPGANAEVEEVEPGVFELLTVNLNVVDVMDEPVVKEKDITAPVLMGLVPQLFEGVVPVPSAEPVFKGGFPDSMLGQQVFLFGRNDRHEIEAFDMSKVAPIKNDWDKPEGGVWTSTVETSLFDPSEPLNTDWIRWCDTNKPEWVDGKHVYRLTPVQGAKILRIQTADQAEAFKTKYLKTGRFGTFIDYEQIAIDGYDGVRFGEKAHRHVGPMFDCESTVWLTKRFDVEYLGVYQLSEDGEVSFPEVPASSTVLDDEVKPEPQAEKIVPEATPSPIVASAAVEAKPQVLSPLTAALGVTSPCDPEPKAESPIPRKEKELQNADTPLGKRIAELNAEGAEEIRLVSSDETYSTMVVTKNGTVLFDGRKYAVNGLVVFSLDADANIVHEGKLTAEGLMIALQQKVARLGGNSAKEWVRAVMGKFPTLSANMSAVKNQAVRNQVRLVQYVYGNGDLLTQMGNRLTPQTLEKAALHYEIGVSTGRMASDGRVLLGDIAAHATPGLVVRGKTLHTIFKSLNQVPSRFQLEAHLDMMKYANDHLLVDRKITGIEGVAQKGMPFFTAIGSSMLFIGGMCIISESAAKKGAVLETIELFRYKKTDREVIDLNAFPGVVYNKGDILGTINDELIECKRDGVTVMAPETRGNLVIQKGTYERPLMVGDKPRGFVKMTIGAIWPDHLMPEVDGRRVEVLMGAKSSGKNPAFQLELAGWEGSLLPEDVDQQNEAIEGLPRVTLKLSDRDDEHEFRYGTLTLGIEGPGAKALASVRKGKLPIMSIPLMQMSDHMSQTLMALDNAQDGRRRDIVSVMAASAGSGDAQMKTKLTADEIKLVEEAVFSGLIDSPYLESGDVLLEIAGRRGAVLRVGEFKLTIPSAAAVKEYFTYPENGRLVLNPVMVIARKALAELAMPASSGIYRMDEALDRYYSNLRLQVGKKNLVQDLMGLQLTKLNGRLEFSWDVPLGAVYIGPKTWNKAGCPEWFFGSRTPTISPDALFPLRVYTHAGSEGVIRLHPYWAMILMNADADGDGIGFFVIHPDTVKNYDEVVAEFKRRLEWFESGEAVAEFVAAHYGEEDTKYDEELEDATSEFTWGITWKEFQMDHVRRMIAFSAAQQAAVGLNTQTVARAANALVKAYKLGIVGKTEARRIHNAVCKSIQNGLDGMKHVDVLEILKDIENGGKLKPNGELGHLVTDFTADFDQAVRAAFKMVEGNKTPSEKAILRVLNAAKAEGIQLDKADLMLILDMMVEKDVQVASNLVAASSSSARFDVQKWNDLVEQANAAGSTDLAMISTLKKYGRVLNPYLVPKIENAGGVKTLVIREVESFLADKIDKGVLNALVNRIVKVQGSHDFGSETIVERFEKKAYTFPSIQKDTLRRALAGAMIIESGSKVPFEARVRAAYRIEPTWTRKIVELALKKLQVKVLDPNKELTVKGDLSL